MPKAIALATFENDTEGLVRRGDDLPELSASRFKALELAGLVAEPTAAVKILDAQQAFPKRAADPDNKKAQDSANKNGRGGSRNASSNV